MWFYCLALVAQLGSVAGSAQSAGSPDTTKSVRIDGAGFSVLMPKGWEIEKQHGGQAVWARKVRKALFSPVQLTELMTGVDTVKDQHRSLVPADFVDTLLDVEVTGLRAQEQRGEAVLKRFSTGQDTVAGREMRCLAYEKSLKPGGEEATGRFCVFVTDSFPADPRFVVFFTSDTHPKKGLATPGVVLMAIKHDPELFDIMVSSLVLSTRAIVLTRRDGR